MSKSSVSTKPLEISGSEPCLFSDGFKFSERSDDLFLLEFLCHVPSGFQLNSRTMLNRETLENLSTSITKILGKSSKKPAKKRST